MQTNNSAVYLLMIGLIASIVVGVGEYLLHYLPQGPGGEIDMLLDVPLDRASYGHFLVVFGAPLYYAGYYGIYSIFRGSHPKAALTMLILGVAAFSVGGVWVSSRYFAAFTLQATVDSELYVGVLENYEHHYQVLVWFLRLVVAMISICYIYLIINNRLNIPKWIAIANPIVLLIIVISSLFWLEPLGNHIAPIAMNVTHFIFFGILLVSINKSQQISQR